MDVALFILYPVPFQPRDEICRCTIFGGTVYLSNRGHSTGALKRPWRNHPVSMAVIYGYYGAQSVSKEQSGLTQCRSPAKDPTSNLQQSARDLYRVQGGRGRRSPTYPVPASRWILSGSQPVVNTAVSTHAGGGRGCRPPTLVG